MLKVGDVLTEEEFEGRYGSSRFQSSLWGTNYSDRLIHSALTNSLFDVVGYSPSSLYIKSSIADPSSIRPVLAPKRCP